ncbi:hypothetical protein [Sphingomonas bacterium]|uniref:hypothetical protein n=1 Tax=Sphingomonas bacterium TaxID=1895847 RepID=UPI00157604FE|nr:hypothetical protein [Sphingomonas bacterium]
MGTSTPPTLKSDPQGDPHGRAALVLMDSLIHALVDGGTLTDEQAVDIVVDAATVQAETEYKEQDAERLHDSLMMLDRIVAGLRTVSLKPSLV